MTVKAFKKKYKDSRGIVIKNHRSSDASLDKFLKTLTECKCASDDCELVKIKSGEVAFIADKFETAAFFQFVMKRPPLPMLGVKIETVYNYCK